MKTGPQAQVRPTNAGIAQLLAYMQARGWSQREFARLAGFSQNRLHRLIKGTSTLSVLEAFELEKLTDGDVPARSWTVKLTPA